jgi:hypothetical protein
MASTDDAGSLTAEQRCGMAMFGLHVVALIDLLGQPAQLAKWDSVPQRATETSAWESAVRNTVGRMLMWRDEFNKRFEGYLQTLRNGQEQFALSRPPEVLQQFDEYRQTTIQHQHFSDSLIFYSPLVNEHGYLQVSNVIAMLCTCGALMLEALRRQSVFRGAIEVGVLTRFPAETEGCPGDPYGPALAKAHCLESMAAEYPRIVVGPGVLSYLEALRKDAADDSPARANRVVADLCCHHIAKDSDGRWIVDYLNDTFARAGGKPAGWRQTQADAFTFVQAELARFRNEGNEKLLKRYERLAAYFVAHGSG